MCSLCVQINDFSSVCVFACLCVAQGYDLTERSVLGTRIFYLVMY